MAEKQSKPPLKSTSQQKKPAVSYPVAYPCPICHKGSTSFKGMARGNVTYRKCVGTKNDPGCGHTFTCTKKPASDLIMVLVEVPSGKSINLEHVKR